jgi:hypothetical protein
MFGQTENQKRIRAALFGTAVRFKALVDLPGHRSSDHLSRSSWMNLGANSEPADRPGLLNQAENLRART